MKRKKRGGKRVGSGRKKETEPRKRFTKLVPVSLYDKVVEAVKEILTNTNKQ